MATGKSSEEHKRDPIKQDSEESPLGSSPDGDLGEQGDDQANPTPESQAPKRKGGRKPVCHGPLCHIVCRMDFCAPTSPGPVEDTMHKTGQGIHSFAVTED